MVAGYLHMLLGARGQGLTPEQRRVVELANASCQRALELTHELSDLARLHAGTAVLNAGHTDVGRILGEAVAAAQRRVTDVTIDYVAPGLPLPITADAERLRHALESLVVAVAREMPEHAVLAVSVESARRPDGAEAIDHQIMVSIGPRSVPEDQRPAEPSPPGTEREFDQFRGGLGLSLPIAGLFIGTLGGTIHARGPSGLTIAFPAATS